VHQLYRTRLLIDLPLIGLGLAGASAVLVEVAPASCLPDCVPPAAMNALDRLTVGGFSQPALTVANIVLTLLLVAPLVVELARTRGRGMWPTLVVYAQALVLTIGLTQVLKFTVGRLAPFVYTPYETPADVLFGLDAARSFPSGHTSTAFVAAAVLVVGWWLRDSSRSMRVVVLFAALSAASAVGVLKVVAGYHYWTDVLSGALIGAAIGVLVTALHRRAAHGPASAL
jgi:membrane-associated phospholipid phosphatase